MNSLFIVAHPDLKTSIYNQKIVKKLENDLKISDLKIKKLYDLYPSFHIDIAQEQHDLLWADRIIFQFPLYWYNVPALLKQWQDSVLTFGFAYGAVHQLQGKKLLLSVTAGSSAPEDVVFEIQEKWSQVFHLLAKFCQIEFEGLVISYGCSPQLTLEDQEKKVNLHIEKLRKILK